MAANPKAIAKADAMYYAAVAKAYATKATTYANNGVACAPPRFQEVNPREESIQRVDARGKAPPPNSNSDENVEGRMLKSRRLSTAAIAGIECCCGHQHSPRVPAS